MLNYDCMQNICKYLGAEEIFKLYSLNNVCLNKMLRLPQLHCNCQEKLIYKSVTTNENCVNYMRYLYYEFFSKFNVDEKKFQFCKNHGVFEINVSPYFCKHILNPEFFKQKCIKDILNYMKTSKFFNRLDEMSEIYSFDGPIDLYTINKLSKSNYGSKFRSYTVYIYPKENCISLELFTFVKHKVNKIFYGKVLFWEVMYDCEVMYQNPNEHC